MRCFRLFEISAIWFSTVEATCGQNGVICPDCAQYEENENNGVLALPWPRAFWTPGVPERVYETDYHRGKAGYMGEAAVPVPGNDFLCAVPAGAEDPWWHERVDVVWEGTDESPYTRYIPKGDKGRVDVEPAKLKSIAYDGPSIRKRILDMLNGDGEEFYVHIPFSCDYPTSHRTTLFFNKKKIAMYNSCYLTHITRYGNGAMRRHGTYGDNKHSSVTQVYFTGKYGNRVIIHKRLMAGHMDLSYKVEQAHLHKLVDKYARIYLKHYGYTATTIRKAITPMVHESCSYPETDKYKGAWRGTTIKDVLRAAGLPTGKAVVKALGSTLMFSAMGRAPHGGPPRFPLVNLTLLRLIWCICGDPTVLRDAIYARCDMAFQVWHTPKGYNFHRHIKSLIKPFTKRERIALARSIVDQTAHTLKKSGYNDRYTYSTGSMGIVVDFLSMARDKYTDARDTVVTSRTVRALHDEMSTHVDVAVLRKAEDIDIDADIDYPEAVADIDGTMLPDGYQVVLPKTGVDLVSLGVCLHNCIGGYARRVIKQETAVAALYLDGKLFGAFEVQGGKVRQVSAYCNHEVTPALRIHLDKLVGEMDYYETGNAVQGVFQQAQVPHAAVAAPAVILPPAVVMENQGAMFLATEPHQPDTYLDECGPMARATPRVESDETVPF